MSYFSYNFFPPQYFSYAYFIDPAFTPADPTGVNVATGSSMTQLIWNAQNDAVSFEVWRGLLANHSDAVLKASVLGAEAHYDDHTTENGVHYYYRLRAIGTGGSSNFVNADGIAEGPVPSGGSSGNFGFIESPGVHF